jgi:hypothetical protein
MSEIQRLIEAYRKVLKPGVYFFSGKMDSGTIIGIEETIGEYVSHEDRDRYGVILAYSHLGLRGDNVKRLTTSVEETPQQFQMKLIEYLKQKLETL